ncbi:RNA polymerase sigma factor, partial [Ruminococcaceae bacterium OttesenSCG-928-A16]|nr:RNA polymerase sigma factor [Ruminococcaceae bacterium OttesenSCG-928-A16]
MEKNKLDAIVEQAIKGNKKAFEELCQLKGRSIVYLCVQDMGNQADGEDAAQEVFIKMHKNIQRLKSARAFNTWLQKIIRTTCIDMRQTTMKKNNSLSLNDFADYLPEDELEYLPQEYIEDEESKKRLISIINNLPRSLRMTVMLYYFEGLSYDEIAQIRGISHAAINQNLYRARLQIRKQIEEQQPDAYAQQKAPMLLLAGILQQDANKKVPLAVVNKCMAAAVTPGHGAFAWALCKTTALVFSTIAVLVFAVHTVFPPASNPLVAAASSAVSLPQGMPQNAAVASGVEDSPDSLAAGQPAPLPAAQAPQPAPQGEAQLPVSAVSQQAVQQAPPQPTLATLQGSVQMLNTAGNVVPGGGKYASGYTVVLLEDTAQIATTEVGADGTYTFNHINIAAQKTVTLQLVPPSNRHLGFGGSTPNGSLQMQLQPGQTTYTAPAFCIADMQEPIIGVYATGADSTPTQVNPTGLDILLSDETDTACEWVLTDQAGQPLHSG